MQTVPICGQIIYHRGICALIQRVFHVGQTAGNAEVRKPALQIRSRHNPGSALLCAVIRECSCQHCQLSCYRGSSHGCSAVVFIGNLTCICKPKLAQINLRKRQFGTACHQTDLDVFKVEFGFCLNTFGKIIAFSVILIR